MFFLTAIIVLGFIAGFASGLLGVGGGIIIIPSFLYILPLFGFKPLSINEITGIASAQVFAGSLFAFLEHRKYGLIQKDLIYTIGAGVAIGALFGSIISKFIPDKILLIIYFIMLISSIIVLSIKRSQENIDFNKQIRPGLASISSAIAGAFSGALGLGGAVLYIPIIKNFYNMPIKHSISNVTYIVLITAIFTILGKAATHQMPYHLLIFIVTGALFGAKLGTRLSHKLSSTLLTGILLFIISLTALRVLLSILQ